MTDEELDALVACLRELATYYEVATEAASAITTLRAQLAEARAERDREFAAHERNYASTMKSATGAINRETARADRAEAALAAQIEVDAWQPIETAPKDGTFFLAWFSSRKKHCVAWRRKHVIDGDLWASFLDVYPDRWSSQPTHWMPLPNPPPNQPHDRTALYRMLTEAREKALREAAACAIDNQDCSPWEISDAILALIEVKP